MPITIGAYSHPGRVRPNNEDRFLTLAPPQSRPGIDALLVVADGMGGAQAGEVASGMVVDILAQIFRRDKDVTLTGSRVDWSSVLERAIDDANALIFTAAASAPELWGMGSTLAAALVVGELVHVANVGDSRCYLISGREIYQVTSDHSWVEEQVRAGLLDAAAARVHPRRNILTRSMGTDRTVAIDIRTVETTPGDHLVLCSDGVSNLVEDVEMTGLVEGASTPQNAAESIVELALRRGAPDNVTVVVGTFTPNPAIRPAT